MKIVETDNFDGDWPNETFLPIPPVSVVRAKRIAEAINESFPASFPRYWKVVDNDYELKKGFEP